MPSTDGSTGTFRQPRNVRPSLATMTSKMFFAWLRFSSSCGRKNIPTPYSRSEGKEKPRGSQTLEKNLCEICNKIPTPSPVLPSASLPALCSRFSTIFSASATVSWLFAPLMFTTAPIPQLSCSNSGRYKPSNRALFTFPITVILSSSCPLAGPGNHSQLPFHLLYRIF